MRRTTRRVGRRWLVTAAVAAIALAACSGGDDDATPASSTGPVTVAADPLAAVREAADRSHDAGTAKVGHHLLFDAGALNADELAVGVTDLATGDAAWETDMSRTPGGIVPEGTSADQVRMAVVEAGGDLYLTFPAAFAAVGIEGEHLRLSARPEEGAGFPQMPNGLHSRIVLSGRFARTAVGYSLLDTATAAREVGPASVRGRPTTRYSVDASVRAMLDEAGLMFFFGNPTDPAKLAELDEVFADASTVDVYLDEEGRVAKIQLDADLSLVAPVFDPPQSPDVWKRLLLEWEFYDYGTELDPITPPTGSVVDVPS